MFKSIFATGMVMLLALTGCNAGMNPFAAQIGGVPQDKQQSTQQGSGGKVAATYEHPGMFDPSKAVEQAPATFKVKFETTKGDMIIECHRAWSPEGADRFYNLCKIGYMKDIAIFRAIEGFMIQFGIHGDPAVSAKWSEANIKDDPRVEKISNEPGYITFAKTGAPNSRSTQMFLNLGNNGGLDPQGFTPFGKVIDGMNVLQRINTEYGENRGDIQGQFKRQGNEFIKKKYPNIDFIKSATLVED